jgi:hypothetical protein
MLPFW